MALDQKKFSYDYDHLLRDSRPFARRMADFYEKSDVAATVFFVTTLCLWLVPAALWFADAILLFMIWYFRWLCGRKREVPCRMPSTSIFKDPKNGRDGKAGPSEGIIYLGNKKETNEEIWFTNSDARTHILYLGTTGAGKTVGLRSLASNALCWASGFVYVDGKADTDLWSTLSAMVRRFGRDDDLFVLNYMTGNSDKAAPSNSMNPFSVGSASYLTNMLVSLMPPSEGDNAMWKERAVSLVGSLMPALTWKRDNQDIPMSVSMIRNALELKAIIRLSRDEALPEKIKEGLRGYLNTLPGYNDKAFNDDGSDKPPGPDTPMVDINVISQQHGYLTMQFTRSLQSLGDDYGYIFNVQNADVDMVDIVLNRRMLVVLIPALEKSGDETANLGKIVAATIKGMMGSTLGSTVEGSSSKVIENKPTACSTPFMTIFDEVGYYTAEGMAVMAAQARSLGFSLVFSAQDLPALEKRVKEEARSIAGNCNIKIFGKLEDPTQTKEFFEKTVGDSLVTEVSSFNIDESGMGGGYRDGKSAGVQVRSNASYDGTRAFKEGEAVLAFTDTVEDIQVYYCNPGNAKAMRVQKFLAFDPPNEQFLRRIGSITAVRDRMVSKTWTATKADVEHVSEPELEALGDGFVMGRRGDLDMLDAGNMAVAHAYAKGNDIDPNSIEVKKPAKKPDAPVKKEAEQKSPLAAMASSKSTDGEHEREAKNSDWTDLVDEEQEEEEEGKSSGGSKAPKKVSREEYDAQDAAETFADTGEYTFPDGLSDEVQAILSDAASDLKAGLFGNPEIEKAPDPAPQEDKKDKPKSPDGK